MGMKIIFRKPSFPVVFSFNNNIYAARSVKKLAYMLERTVADGFDDTVYVVDSEGEEFWYHAKHDGLAPGIIRKSWPKKRLISLFNESENVKNAGLFVSDRSLSSRRYKQIVDEIVNFTIKLQRGI
jgi:hypothetical protein